MKQFIIAHEEVAHEENGTPIEEQFVEFEVGEADAEGNATNVRTLRAYQPHEGQLTFMLAALGRGQTQDQRYAGIVNILMSSLRDDDQDYLESRLLLQKGDPRRLPLKTLEGIFEYVIEEWFRPTVSSGGAPERTGSGQVG